MVSPPQLSGINSYSVNSCITCCGLAAGLSILFTATIIGTLAALAWLIASTVCGITPSSAATTKIVISVILAPRARILVKAACPGVSKKVIGLPSISIWYAPICWVIPPASPLVTRELRKVSSKVVLPWSTCPMIVTTGGRATKFSSLISSGSKNLSISAISTWTFSCASIP